MRTRANIYGRTTRSLIGGMYNGRSVRRNPRNPYALQYTNRPVRKWTRRQHAAPRRRRRRTVRRR